MYFTQCLRVTEVSNRLVQDSRDPIILQPTTIELATIHKKPDEELVSIQVESLWRVRAAIESNVCIQCTVEPQCNESRVNSFIFNKRGILIYKRDWTGSGLTLNYLSIKQTDRSKLRNTNVSVLLSCLIDGVLLYKHLTKVLNCTNSVCNKVDLTP